MQHTQKPLVALANTKGGASMMNLATLLQQCGTEEADPKELISFVDDIDEETGKVTTVKVVF